MSSSDDRSEKGDDQEPQNFYSEDVENQNNDHNILRRTTTMSSQPEQDHLQRILTDPAQKNVDYSDIPELGAGKALPPNLPDREAWRVDFNGPQDPLHPQNWPLKKKFFLCAILGYATFTASWGSAVFSPAVPVICEMYSIGTTPGLLTISLYICGFASGPIIWGPMSELYGRKLPLVLSSFLFTCFNFATATAENLHTIMLCRFFSGFVSAAPLAIVAACFADIWNALDRGISISVFSGTVFLAPILSPVVGAFIVDSYLGWRWTMYITGIMSSLSLVLLVLFFEESYHPMILAKKAAEMRKKTGNWGIYAPHEAVELNINEIVSKNILRPLRMLIVEPILLLLTLYTAFIYGLLYMLLEAYPIVFGEKYGMTGGVSQLPYLGLIVGMLISMASMVFYFEPRYNRIITKNDYKPIPEQRVPCMLAGALVFPVGIFMFAWCGNYSEQVHWMAPTAAGVLIGMGILSIFVACFQFIIDSYLLLAASAISANTFLRSGFGAAFPLFATQMFHNLGVNWAGTLVGCLAVVFMPIPLFFWYFGPKLRTKSQYAMVL